MRLRPLALTLALAALAAACGDDPADPSTPVVPQTPPALLESELELEPEIAVEIPAETSIRLLDAGSAPRAALRFSIPEGTRQGVRIATRTDVGVTVDGRPVERPASIEGSELVLQLTAGGATEDGGVDLAFEITDVTPILADALPAPQADAMRRAMRSGIGIHGSLARDARGICEVTSVRPPPGMVGPKPPGIEDSVQQSMDVISVPVPVEEVGVGARWEVVSPRSRSGAHVRMTRTYELLARDGDGDVIVLDLTVRQQGAPTDVVLPGLDPRAKPRLHGLSADGTGRIEASLSRIVPDRATLTLDDETVFVITDPDNQTVMRRTTRLFFEIDAD